MGIIDLPTEDNLPENKTEQIRDWMFDVGEMCFRGLYDYHFLFLENPAFTSAFGYEGFVFKPADSLSDRIRLYQAIPVYENELRAFEAIPQLEESQSFVKTICDFYSNYKEKKYTICCGDLFYYHLTEQNKFCQLVIKSKKNEYLRNILKMHIQQIEKNENQIRLIYINNATASRWIYEAIKQKGDKDDYPSYYDYELDGKTYRIFFGAMLSGLRAMDVFSRKRLIMEIQQYLKKN